MAHCLLMKVNESCDLGKKGKERSLQDKGSLHRVETIHCMLRTKLRRTELEKRRKRKRDNIIGDEVIGGVLFSSIDRL